MKRYTLVFLFLLLALAGVSQPGSPDLSFGENGMLTTQAGVSVKTLLIQPEGKILISSETGVWRFFEDGTPDLGFGLNGFTLIRNTAGENYRTETIAGMQYWKDGSIILAGNIGDRFDPKKLNPWICRLQSNGRIDSSFGLNGHTVIPFETNEYFDVPGYQLLSLQKDGKILIAGRKETRPVIGTSGHLTGFRVRLTNNGIADVSFGENGIETWDKGADCGYSGNLNRPDDKVLVTGWYRTDVPQNKSFVYNKQFLADGDTPDSSYGSNGIAEVEMESDYFGGSVQAFLSDGKAISIFTKTDVQVLKQNEIIINRYNSDGTRDYSFGDKGWISEKSDNRRDDIFIHKVLVDEHDNMLICGFINKASDKSKTGPFIFRYKRDGSPDSSFAVNGKLFDSFDREADTSLQDEFEDMVFTREGKILAAGAYPIDNNGNYYTGLAQYNNETVMPVRFTSISSQASPESVTLRWSVAEEENMLTYNIERSSSSTNFVRIGSVPVTSNSSGISSYSFTDKEPLPGINIYLIKAISSDGQTAYSPAIQSLFNASGTLRISPNPVQDILKIEGLLPAIRYQAHIQQVNGSLIRSVSIQQSSSYQWPLQQIPTGTYLLVIDDDVSIQSFKFVKL